MAFRLAGINLLLTYPQSGDLAEQEVYDVVNNSYPVAYGVVSREVHSDGLPHLHAWFHLHEKAYIWNSNALDIRGKHGNYQVPYDPKAALRYVVKDGLCTYFSVESLEQCLIQLTGSKKRKVWDCIGERIVKGHTVKQIISSDPSLFFHLKQIDLAVSQQALWALPSKPGLGHVEAICCPGVGSMSSSDVSIAAWLLVNVVKAPARAFKQSQLYIWGPPNMGKTTLVNKLCDCLNVYIAPYDGEWFDEFSDSYDLVVFDEFRCQYKIQLLNGFLDGSIKPLRRRGKPPVLKQRNLPVIILSNYSISQNYHNVDAERLDTLEARLLVVQVTEFIGVQIVPKISMQNVIELRSGSPPLSEQSSGSSDQGVSDNTPVVG